MKSSDAVSEKYKLAIKALGRIALAGISVPALAYTYATFYAATLPWWIAFIMCLFAPTAALAGAVSAWILLHFGGLHAPIVMPHS